eukprot:NODE_1007_length_2283_cov_0.244048.p1 type:complete len:256 gc:universal NODE_1007_length_2283_cov_0.244048:1499-732(-)
MTHTAERKQSFADLLKNNTRSHSINEDMHKLQIKQAIQNVQNGHNDLDSGVEWEDPMKRQRSKSIVLGMPSIWSDKRRSSTEPTAVRRHSLYPQMNGYQNLLENVEMDIQELDNIGQGRPLDELLNDILYLIEFKGGRSDVFYYSGDLLLVNQLVIVEADRGKDLGKIIQNTLTGQHLKNLYLNNPEALTDLHKINKQIYPRKIYRSAQPSEVTMLVSKSQDEFKALQSCQIKAQERQLPMSVVDCEFQWFFVLM